VKTPQNRPGSWEAGKLEGLMAERLANNSAFQPPGLPASQPFALSDVYVIWCFYNLVLETWDAFQILRLMSKKYIEI
jgi:hypothetical protein